MAPSILILDDDLSWKNTLTNLFQRMGFDVTSSLEGQTIIQYAYEDISDKYKAAIVDLILEGQPLQGPALCHELKKLKPYLPVFAVTANTDPREIAEAILKTGFDGFIAKADLDLNATSYANHLKSVIATLEAYPQLPTLWRQIAQLSSAKYKYALRGKLAKKIRNVLKKAYFYLILPTSTPLLSLVQIDVNSPYSESIIQSVIAVETIANNEFEKWQKKWEGHQLGDISDSRYDKIDHVVNQGLFPSGAEDELADNIFRLRDKCAHQYYAADKRQAIGVLAKTLEIVHYYFEMKLSNFTSFST
jgi:CheY-like chemotaxis protein